MTIGGTLQSENRLIFRQLQQRLDPMNERRAALRGMASRSKDASARGLIPRLSDSRLIFARGQFRPRPWARCCRFNNATRHCVSVPILARVFVTTDKSLQQQPFRFGTFIEGAGPYSACLAVTHFHRRNEFISECERFGGGGIIRGPRHPVNYS